MPSSTSSSALARRAKRCAAEPSHVSSIRSCRDALSRKPGRITRSAESRSPRLASDSFGFPETRGINQHSIPDVASNEAARSRHGRRYTALIGPNYGAEIFGIEPSRQCCGARQVAEHHAELTSLCNRSWREIDPPILPLCLVGLVGGSRGTHRRDRSEKHAPMADRGDADILKVICRQARQDLGGDTVSVKRRSIAAHS